VTFKQIQDAVLANAFDESLRAQVKDHINHRYQMLWVAEEWGFVYETALVSVTAGSNVVTGLPSDFGNPLSLQNSAGDPREEEGDPDQPPHQPLRAVEARGGR